MRRRLAIVDVQAPRAYSGAPGELSRLGGTEATVTRIAEGLVATQSVDVFQAARNQCQRVNGVAYLPFSAGQPLAGNPHEIIVINAWKVAVRLRRHHPALRIWVWLHVYPGRHNRAMGAALVKADIGVICVSRSHAERLAAFLPGPLPRITHIFNPIPDALAPDSTSRDPDRLLFASSPHKGLDEIFTLFAQLRQRWPALCLAVADPGYLHWPTGAPPEGVVFLGRLDPPALMDQMRRSLCLFYPQTRFAETFGLVIAEANAVGCPALVHRGLGANDEICSTIDQGVDGTDIDAIAARLLRWRGTAPVVTARPEFRQSAVLADWGRLLSGRWPVCPQPTIAGIRTPFEAGVLDA
ncbi:MAG: glycosyltransferase [Pararhodobacter sp.]